MLRSRAVTRGVPRLLVQSGRSAVVWRRFMAVAPADTSVSTASTSETTNSSKPENINTENTTNRPKQFNRKVRDISQQVRKSVDGAGLELSEAIDILEEGISYLREIQQAEKIPDDLLFAVFQPITAQLFDKLSAPNAILGAHTMDLVLDMLIANKIAHQYHFLKVAEAKLRAHPNTEGYTEVLQLWLRRLEYIKDVGVGRMQHTLTRPFMVHRERNYDSRTLGNLVYFAFVMQLMDAGAEYNMKDAMKVLQIDDPARVPDRRFVAQAVLNLHTDELAEQLARFERQIGELNVKAMDPNSAYVSRRIESAIEQHNPAMLSTLFEQMKTASVANELAISEPTFNRVMNGFIELHRFDDVMEIFRNLLETKKKPSVASWDLVIKAMGHPTHVKSMSAADKKQMASNVETTVSTMVASGIDMNARTLAVVLGAFANLDRFDLVDKYLETYNNVPMVHLARNNILVGLVANGRIGEAEKKLKEYTAADPTYQPSTAVMNGYLAYYVDSGNTDAVEGILRYMRQHSIEEDVATVTTFIGYFFKMYRQKGMVPDVTVLLEQLKDKVPTNDMAATTIVDGLAKDGINLEAARTMYDHFCKAKPRLKHSMGLLTVMIKAEVDFGSVARAEEMFDTYVTKLRNETRAWNMMIAALLPKHEDLALQYYARLLEQQPFNVVPNYYTYYFMLDHFNKTGDKARVQWVIDEIAKSVMTDLGKALPRMLYRMRSDYVLGPHLLEQVSPGRR